MIQRLSQLETTVGELQNENSQSKTTIETLQSNLKSVSDSKTLLEDRIKQQEDLNKTQAEVIQQLTTEFAEFKKQASAADPMAIITNPQTEEDSIISVVQQYYDAKKWEDRVPFTYKPEIVRPLMQKYYSSGYTKSAIDKSTISIPKEGYKVGDKFIVTTRNQLGFAQNIYMRKTSEGFKIDWEAIVGYNKESVSSYSARTGTNKIIVRVNFDYISSAKNRDFGVGDNYYTVLDEKSIFILKSSAVGQRIAQLMADGSNVNLIIEIQGQMKPHKDGVLNDKYFLFATRIVSEDWFSEY